MNKYIHNRYWLMQNKISIRYFILNLLVTILYINIFCLDSISYANEMKRYKGVIIREEIEGMKFYYLKREDEKLIYVCASWELTNQIKECIKNSLNNNIKVEISGITEISEGEEGFNIDTIQCRILQNGKEPLYTQLSFSEIKRNISTAKKFSISMTMNESEAKKNQIRSIDAERIEMADSPVGQFPIGIVYQDKEPICKGLIDYDSINNAWICTMQQPNSNEIMSVWFPIDKTRDELAGERMFDGYRKKSGYIGFQVVTPNGPLLADYENKISSSGLSWLDKLIKGTSSYEKIKSRRFKRNISIYCLHIEFPFTEQEMWNEYDRKWQYLNTSR